MPDTAGSENLQVAITWCTPLALLCLCWLYKLGAWLVPKLVSPGAKLLQVEQEHRYIPQLMLAVGKLVLVVGTSVRLIADILPLMALRPMLEYVAVGLRGAFHEFAERVVVRENPEMAIMRWRDIN